MRDLDMAKSQTRRPTARAGHRGGEPDECGTIKWSKPEMVQTITSNRTSLHQDQRTKRRNANRE